MQGYQETYVNEATGEEIPHWDEASNIHYKDNKSGVPRLNVETVQGAIEELAKKSNNPTPTPGTGSSDTYYLIKAEDWGLTKSYKLPERGKHYVKNNDVQIPNAQTYDDTITYEQMHLNGWGIEQAIQYAYKNGYCGVVLERGIYYVIPENESYEDEDYTQITDTATPFSIRKAQHSDFRGTINIYGVENFDINLNGSTLCYVVDSAPERYNNQYDDLYRNPYYTTYETKEYTSTNTGKKVYILDGDKPIQNYVINAMLFILAACKNVTLRNGTLRGDAHTRSFINSSEAYQEQTYGITNGRFCYNTIITGIDVSGFMGDGISTGGGSDLYLRDDRHTVIVPALNTTDDRDTFLNNPIPDESLNVEQDNDKYSTYHRTFNAYRSIEDGKSLATSVLSYIRPYIKYTSYSLSYNTNTNTTRVKATENDATKAAYTNVKHYNTSMLWFKGPGYEMDGGNIRFIPNPSSYCTLSLYVNLQNSNLTIRNGDRDENNAGTSLWPANGAKLSYYYDAYLGNTKSNGDFNVVKDVLSKRMFSIFAGTGTKLYWPKINILTYVQSWFPVVYNNQPYIYDVIEDEVYIATVSNNKWTRTNQKVNKQQFLNAQTGTVLFCEIVKRVYNPFDYRFGYYFNGTLGYFEYTNTLSGSFTYYDANGNVRSTLLNGEETFVREFFQEYYYPNRVIDISNTGDFNLTADEKLIRIQCFYDKGYYGIENLEYNDEDATIPNITYPNSIFKGEYDEAVNFESKLKGIRGNTVELSLYGSNNLIVDNCVVHDNFRGGITGGIKDLVIRNSVFYKKRRKKITPTDDYTIQTCTNENGETEYIIPRFRSTTNYSIDIEEGFTSNTEVYNCRFTDNNSILVLSGLNFNFHHNITYAQIMLRNMINTNIHHNVFYGDILNLDWWKLGSSMIKESNTNYSDDEEQMMNEAFSDSIGNVPGYADKIANGSSYMERNININHNICHAFTLPFRYFWKTVFNINNNTLYLAEKQVAWRGYAKSLDELIYALRGSIFANNRVVIVQTYFDGNASQIFNQLKSNYYSKFVFSLPLFGNSYNNVLDNKGGVSRNVCVSPLGPASSNTCINGGIRLGDRKTNLNPDHDENYYGVTLFEGFKFYNYTYIRSCFGDPTLLNTVRNCEFHGNIYQESLYFPIDKTHSLAYPSNAYNQRVSPPVINIVPGTTSADRIREVYISYPDDIPSNIKAQCFIAYSLDGSIFQYIDEGEYIQLDKDSVVSAIITRQGGPLNELCLTTEVVSRVIYVNHYYIDENNDRVGIEIDDPESTVYDNYQEYPDSIDTNTEQLLTIKFINCTFYKPFNIPVFTNSASNGYKTRLHLIFDRCDFTNVEENCITVVPSEIDTSGTLTGLQSNKIYYDTDTNRFVKATSTSAIDENRTATVEVINSYTNEDFTIYKTAGGVCNTKFGKFRNVIFLSASEYSNLPSKDSSTIYLIEEDD